MAACGFKAKAYAGNEGTTGLSSWDQAKWTEEWQSLNVLVMTPEVLLHILAHGYMSVSGSVYMATPSKWAAHTRHCIDL